MFPLLHTERPSVPSSLVVIRMRRGRLQFAGAMTVSRVKYRTEDENSNIRLSEPRTLLSSANTAPILSFEEVKDSALLWLLIGCTPPNKDIWLAAIDACCGANRASENHAIGNWNINKGFTYLAKSAATSLQQCSAVCIALPSLHRNTFKASSVYNTDFISSLGITINPLRTRNILTKYFWRRINDPANTWTSSIRFITGPTLTFTN